MVTLSFRLNWRFQCHSSRSTSRQRVEVYLKRACVTSSHSLSIYLDWHACASSSPISGSDTSDRSHFCRGPSLQGEMNMNNSHSRQTSGFPSRAALKLITAETCCVRKTRCGFDMQTVTYCRLSSLLSLPSSVVSLFLPWGGDGRFLQGKSNNLSRRQMSLHVESVGCRIIQAIFLVIVRKIVHGRLVGVVMHYRSQVVHGTGEVLDVGWCSSFSSTSFCLSCSPDGLAASWMPLWFWFGGSTLTLQ